jgi:Type II secretory pathway, prepilin signal peptidase PulO and related peptidases
MLGTDIARQALGANMIAACIFILGLIIGLLVNLLIYRIPDRSSIIAPSSCKACGTQLKARDLIPVFSWLFLKGKCRYCSANISPRYMVVELMTAFSITCLYLKFGFSAYFLAFSYLMILLVAIFFIDMDHRIIPDELILAGLIGGAAVVVYNFVSPGRMIFGDNNWWTPLVGFFAGSGVLLLVSILGSIIYKSDDAMGMGDVKLMAPIGVFLGWKLCLAALFISILISGLVSLALIVFSLKKRKDTIPFGPFIVIGTYLTILCGWDIIFWYTGML